LSRRKVDSRGLEPLVKGSQEDTVNVLRLLYVILNVTYC